DTVTRQRRGVTLRFERVERIETCLVVGADLDLDDTLLERILPALLERASVLIRERRFPDRNRRLEHVAIRGREREPASRSDRPCRIRAARDGKPRVVLRDLREMERAERVGRRDDAVDDALRERRIDFTHRHVDRVRAEIAHHVHQLARHANPKAPQIIERRHGPLARHETRQAPALHGQNLQALELVRELPMGTREAVIERDLLLDLAHSAVETRLGANQMRTARDVDRRDQPDVDDAMPKLDHRVLGRQERARPDRPDAESPVRSSLDELDPAPIRSARQASEPTGAAPAARASRAPRASAPRSGAGRGAGWPCPGAPPPARGRGAAPPPPAPAGAGWPPESGGTREWAGSR